MLSISNYGSSRNCQSSQMHDYLKNQDQAPDAKPKSSGMQPYDMLKVQSTHCNMVKLNVCLTFRPP